MGLVRKGACDGDTLLLAAGQLTRPMLLTFAESYRAQQLRRFGLALPARHACKHHRERHIFQRCPRRDKVERLKDDANVPPAVEAELAARHLREVLVENSKRAFGRSIETRNQIEEFGF